jgi:hypothetical protein
VNAELDSSFDLARLMRAPHAHKTSSNQPGQPRVDWLIKWSPRTIDAPGQHVIEPQLTLEGWSTSPPKKDFPPETIIALYADHGTHEQFHAALGTDMDLERLPSGKFDTNYLVCALVALAMNVPSLMCQAGLHGPDAPVRHEARRRRIKTEMQELISRAGRLILHGCRLILGLGTDDRAAAAFVRLHGQLRAASG